jgi:hypothetical protein
MNTNYANIDTVTTEQNKSRTLEALFKMICADNEFTLLRKTLELYCEEISAVTGVVE